MFKLIFIGLLLVHISLQIEIAPEEGQDSSRHIEAKKHFKNKEWKDNKKYKDEEGWKKPHYNTEGKKAKIDGEKKPYYDKEKKYNKEKEHVRREIIEAHPYQEGENDESPKQIQQINLSNDINVNKNEQIVDADSEYLQPKRLPTILNLSSPPDPNNTVLMARYIIHKSDWAAMATITTRSGVKQYPFANIISMSDGSVEEGSGVPYFYVTAMDLSTQDIIKVNKASITVTLAQTDYCRKNDLDAQDPRCARVILSGKMKRIKPSTAEEEFATKALFSRHPVMRKWPKDHEFYIAKMKIGQIIVLDRFGGPTYVDVEQYLHPEPAI